MLVFYALLLSHASKFTHHNNYELYKICDIKLHPKNEAALQDI